MDFLILFECKYVYKCYKFYITFVVASYARGHQWPTHRSVDIEWLFSNDYLTVGTGGNIVSAYTCHLNLNKAF